MKRLFHGAWTPEALALSLHLSMILDFGGPANDNGIATPYEQARVRAIQPRRRENEPL